MNVIVLEIQWHKKDKEEAKRMKESWGTRELFCSINVKFIKY